jgi:hypothetical protein
MKIPVVIVTRDGNFYGAFPTRAKADTNMEYWGEAHGVKDISEYEKKHVVFSRGVLMTSAQFGSEEQKKTFKIHEAKKTAPMEKYYQEKRPDLFLT